MFLGLVVSLLLHFPNDQNRNEIDFLEMEINTFVASHCQKCGGCGQERRQRAPPINVLRNVAPPPLGILWNQKSTFSK